MLRVRDWTSLVAAIVTLTLGAMAARGARKDPLARALTALCFVLFGWNFSTIAQRIVHYARAFEILDSVSTALSPALVLEFVIAFMGAGRRHRGLRVGAWSTFGALALTSILVPDSPWWAGAFLACWLAVFLLQMTLLVRYLRRASEASEKARTRIVMAALAFGGACGASDIAHAAGAPAPYLGAVGTIVASALLLTLVLRLDVFEHRVTVRTSLYVASMISAGVIAYLVVLSAFAQSLGVQLLFAVLLAMIGAAAARELALSLAETRARTRHLALVGRFSAQMTHDIRSPLTALLGAVQLLDGTENEYLGLVAEQAKRIATIVDRYDRMARIEPQKTIVSVNDVAYAIARAHAVETALADPDPELDADRALLEAALENVVRNAVEATGQASLVRVETRRSLGLVELRVVDQGPGMDARTLERATEDFFTTKANGSGLGLAFARRVVEAHGGELSITSRRGKGTTVHLRFPVPIAAQSQSRLSVRMSTRMSVKQTLK
jgi:two-component system sensor histidine kinase HydH